MSTDRLSLKVDACYASLAMDASCDPGMDRIPGVFLHDTRHLSTYRWDLDDLVLIDAEVSLRGVTQYWSRFAGMAQSVLAKRVLTMRHDGFDDKLTLSSESLDPQSVRLALETGADFRDLFEVNEVKRRIPYNPPVREAHDDTVRYAYAGQDGVGYGTAITIAKLPSEGFVTLAPRATVEIAVSVRFSSDLSAPEPPPRDIWTEAARQVRRSASPVFEAAFDAVDVLTTSSAEGPYLAAGIPNYVAPFGRDSLISAWFLRDTAPALAHGALRLLARHQGRHTDATTQEEPGKIPHEVRVGELASTGDVPFGPYYGTTDATALFLILLAEMAGREGGDELLRDLRRSAVAALDWIEGAQDADGLIRYAAGKSDRGLAHTSWKDSEDSISYADGTLAAGPIAVVEIQGYAAAALEAAAELDLTDRPAELQRKARDLRASIDALFWMTEEGIHAIAVDAANRQCDTVTSNPGHLLWSGALSPERARAVADRMMRPDLWSGWGLRTLSTDAPRYQPLSYHNGSVWPHDTAIFAAGLLRYGFPQEARAVAETLSHVAETQIGNILPELFGGYAREAHPRPITYANTCRPQAWAAAAHVWTGLLS